MSKTIDKQCNDMIALIEEYRAGRRDIIIVIAGDSSRDDSHSVVATTHCVDSMAHDKLESRAKMMAIGYIRMEAWKRQVCDAPN